MGKKNGKPGHLQEYAAYAGITREVAARQLKRAGIDYSKAFDFKEADRLIAAGRHPSRAKFAKRKLLPVEEPPKNGKLVTYDEAARREKLAKAIEAELRVQKLAASLYDKQAMDHALFNRDRIVRDAILSIPDRLAGMLAAETDQAKCHAMLLKEIHQALVGLTG